MVRSVRSAIAWALVVGGATVVFAQTGDAPAPASAPAPAADSRAPRGRVLSPGEMIARGKEMVAKMQQILRQVVTLQEVARKQKDMVRLNCVNDKLIQIKGGLIMAESAMTGLHEAIARKDDETRQAEFARIDVAHQKTQVLGNEAENCIGEGLSFATESEVRVEVDPTMPEADPTMEVKPEPVIERPPDESPFL